MSKPYFIIGIRHSDNPEHWGLHYGAYERSECDDELDSVQDDEDVVAAKIVHCDDDSQATINAEIDRLNGKAPSVLIIKLQLPMRFTVCAYHRIDADDGYVLVHLPDNKVTPFATYRFYHDNGHCVWGDYLYTDLITEAHQAFQDRITGKRCKA